MNRKSFVKISLITLTILLVAVAGYVVLVKKQEPNDTSQSLVSPVFDTAAWMNTQIPGRILIRDFGDKKLLLTMRDEFEKSNKHRAVYLYDPSAQSLQQVSDEKWHTAASLMTECFSQSQQFTERFKVNGEKLFFGNLEVPIEGVVLISLAYSPSGDKVAVLSADGPRRKGSLMPFFGGGQNSKGQHYHQLFSVVNGSSVGVFVKLSFTTEKEAYPACWSTDEKYVFYTALLNENLTVVKTDVLNK